MLYNDYICLGVIYCLSFDVWVVLWLSYISSEISYIWVICILVRMLTTEGNHLDTVPLTPQLIKLAAPASLYPCIWLGRPSKSNRESFLPPPSSKVYDNVDIHAQEDLKRIFSHKYIIHIFDFLSKGLKFIAGGEDLESFQCFSL